MFRERIKRVYDNLSAGYRTVADFLLDYPFEAAFMTASGLAERLGVDTATVVRFAQRLEYEGYPELLDDVRAVVRADIRRTRTPAEAAPGDAGAFRRSLEAEHHNLDQLLSGLDDETIEKVLAAIGDARHILIVGQWAMEALGEFLALWLKALGKSAQAISADALSAGYAFRDLTGQDTVVAFALTGLGVELINTLRVAKTSGARVVVFATARSQAAARLADVQVICPGECIQPGLTSFASMAAAMAALLQVLVARDPDHLARDAAFRQVYDQLLAGYRE